MQVLEAIDPATFGTDADALAQRVRGLMTHELLEIQVLNLTLYAIRVQCKKKIVKKNDSNKII